MLNIILQEYENLTDFERKALQFWGKIVISELSKIIILFLFFMAINKSKEFLFTVSILLPLRCNMGGLHFHTYKGCLLATFIILTMPILILPNVVHITKETGILLLLICFITKMIIGPVINPTRPALSSIDIRNIRIRISVIFVIYILLLLTVLSNDYMACCIWIIIEQTLQLILAKLKRKRSA